MLQQFRFLSGFIEQTQDIMNWNGQMVITVHEYQGIISEQSEHYFFIKFMLIGLRNYEEIADF